MSKKRRNSRRHNNYYPRDKSNYGNVVSLEEYTNGINKSQSNPKEKKKVFKSRRCTPDEIDEIAISIFGPFYTHDEVPKD